MTKKFINDLSYSIFGAAIEVQKQLGPGLLESVYHKCLKHELELRNIKFSSELVIPINYKDLVFDADLRCDLFVEEAIIVELKAVKGFAPIHEAQILSYMKLLESPKGILLNFNSENLFRDGRKTFVNTFFKMLPVN